MPRAEQPVGDEFQFRGISRVAVDEQDRVGGARAPLEDRQGSGSVAGEARCARARRRLYLFHDHRTSANENQGTQVTRASTTSWATKKGATSLYIFMTGLPNA